MDASQNCGLHIQCRQHTAGPGPGSANARSMSPPIRSTSPLNASPRPSASRLASRGTVRESVSSSKLFRDISPTKLYTSTSQTTARTALPDLFRQKDGLGSLRPSYSLDLPSSPMESAQSTPKLLRSLEAQLADKLDSIARMGATDRGFASLKLQTDAHRQVFDAFLHSFTTYRSLLSRIKQTYDDALDDALASVFDNMHMKATLAMSDKQLEDEEMEARNQALHDAALSQKEIKDEVEQQGALAVEAEQRCQQFEEELQNVRSHTAALRLEAQRLSTKIFDARHGLLAASSFATPALLEHLNNSQGKDG